MVAAAAAVAAEEQDCMCSLRSRFDFLAKQGLDLIMETWSRLDGL